MQNRYVADIGDYGNNGLLRWLTGMTGPVMDPEEMLPLGVVWYMYHDFDNAGGRVRYLGNPQEYRECDPVLFDFLGRLVEYGNRNIWAVQQSGILPSDTSYYERYLHYDNGSTTPVRREVRRNWIEGALDAVVRSEMIFVNPDNGIRENGRYRKDGPKYVFMDDLQAFAGIPPGKSLVIYRHLPRYARPEEHPNIVQGLSQILTAELDCQVNALLYRDHPAQACSRAYFIASQPGRHQLIIEGRLGSFITSPWGRLFERVV